MPFSLQRQSDPGCGPELTERFGQRIIDIRDAREHFNIELNGSVKKFRPDGREITHIAVAYACAGPRAPRKEKHGADFA
ncbi:hypothetical protein [Aquabacter cavernae]|uniref:hypothetical protein n=1 Tax=Aquabacter cavernae TaxID=2496029 RepID=UPI000F8F3107|nr:hypothetical protein [Aquabacter cavernae]